MKPLVVAVLGPTATGKSALALAIAERHNGEIINCDSTAVYRGFDIGTDKIAPADRRGIPHHLIDIVDPTDDYTAAQFARDAAAVIHEVHAKGRLPILAGGTGFYYRALTRGLFPGPAKDAALRARLESIAERRDVTLLHRMLRKVDPESALRIQPRDLKRLVRALEVYFLTGRPLTAHFADTASPIPDVEVLPTWDSGERAPVWRAGVSPGPRAPTRRPRRALDVRAHRAGEPALCPAPVDLVPQRA
jgi:tRNA dimethylallyltransferase